MDGRARASSQAAQSRPLDLRANEASAKNAKRAGRLAFDPPFAFSATFRKGY
jgi:hypothetical protein